ncbi:hypothetical protein NQ315_003003 [Exocentrus adspersus]|uniref:Uncharacterized protein n=1 Tax=Exocentrus adspersus TaxID=1586481 RepID=A0AAV8W4Z0_9CUCU|nr:hypothetical protein NQ315_003003 [Exocentrus adspersus]
MAIALKTKDSYKKISDIIKQNYDICNNYSQILLAVCIAAKGDSRPQEPATAQILRYDFKMDDTGKFDFNVDTSDGFHHDANGHHENVGAEDESLVVKGSYSYVGTDGEEYALSYLADKNGFQPSGKHVSEAEREVPISAKRVNEAKECLRFRKNSSTSFPFREQWKQDGNMFPLGSLVCYTDGSRMRNEYSGAGIYLENSGVQQSYSLGSYATILVACCIAANVDCRPQQDPSTAQTLRYDFNVDDSGTFEFNVDTSDGFHHDATGYLENVGTEDESLVVKGSYSYTGLDGVEYKVLLVLCLCVTVNCRPQDSASAQIVRYDLNLDDLGTFSFNVDTSDGFHHDANGYLENQGAEDESLVVKGSYSYITPDGVQYIVTYVADKNGFQPKTTLGVAGAGAGGGGRGGGGFGGGGGLGAECTATLCGTGLECIPQDYAKAKIIRNDFNLKDSGSFELNVDTSDGFHHDAYGYMENEGTKEASLVIRGKYFYIGSDGVLYTVNYVADKNGFQPSGKHIPQIGTPPPPPAVVGQAAPEAGASCIASLCGTGLG